MSAAPAYDVDVYSDGFIRDPFPHYAAMRALGAVVYASAHDNYAIVRYDELASALRDPEAFVSGQGVAASAAANAVTRGNSAASDGERHRAIRQATAPPLMPDELEKIRGAIRAAAEALVDRLVQAREFDAIADLATVLPLAIVREQVGLPDFGKDNMLRWANATFDLLGADNGRAKAALEVFLEQRRFAQTITTDQLKPGSWSKRLFELAADGKLADDLAPVAMRDYLNPSLDTTISAAGQLIYQLGRHPDLWAALRAGAALPRDAVNEAIRLGSPVRSFCRHASRDVEIGDVTIPKDARVMMMFASANRDERAFERPDEFDLARRGRRHLGFGLGVHMCVGQHLAQLEMISLIEAMVARVKTLRVGEPIVAMNNTIYGFAALPCAFDG
jgi:cytochrome P450